MTDPTNDIDALLDELDKAGTYCDEASPSFTEAGARFRRQHAALTALVAERDALKKRVAELEAASKPHYIFGGGRVESIDLRERLVCAALTGLLASVAAGSETVAEWAVDHADATLAEMQKGESDGK